MDCMFEAYLAHEIDNFVPSDIPNTKDPVWILGKEFNAIQEIELIRREVQSLLWCTYRRGFVPIGSPGLTTDKGWGCMLRCGQMALAQAMLKLHLGRDWFWTPETKDPTYLKIITRFEDRRQAPFSIHQIALMGASEGKEVGEWFGPNTVAQVLKKLLVYDEWSSLSIHVALDNTVVKSEIRQLCESDGHWKPLLLLVPLRLGLTDINPIYVKGLKACFTLPQSLGIIGGRPNQALYLIGFVGEDILYLDPHTTQRAGNIESKLTQEQIDTDFTYHCKYASRIPILNMDPSVAVCFLCTSQSDFESLCIGMQEKIVEAEPQPLFELCEERKQLWLPKDCGDVGGAASCSNLDRQFDSEEDFELL